MAEVMITVKAEDLEIGDMIVVGGAEYNILLTDKDDDEYLSLNGIVLLKLQKVDDISNVIKIRMPIDSDVSIVRKIRMVETHGPIACGDRLIFKDVEFEVRQVSIDDRVSNSGIVIECDRNFKR